MNHFPKAEGVLEAISELDQVGKLTHYKSSYADYSAILSPEGAPQKDINNVRVAYLRNYCEEWEWVESNKNEESDNHNGFVLFKRRD